VYNFGRLSDIQSRSDRASSASNGSGHLGTCYGYRIKSAFPFCYLRAGQGPTLWVEQSAEALVDLDPKPLFEWMPRPDRPFHARLHRAGGGYGFWVKEMGWFFVDPTVPSIAMPDSGDPLRIEERVWGIPTALCLLARGDLPIHAAAVDVGGSAVILAAPGRFGKTTLVSAFLEAGYGVLSEDLTCCRAADPPQVIPGPAMLRVRRDSYQRLDIARASVVGEDEERYHLAIEQSLRGGTQALPIRCIIFLRWSDGTDDPIRFEPVAPEDAVRYLWTVTFHFPDDGVRAQCFSSIASLSGAVDMWHLHRPKRFDQLRQTVDRIVDVCL
jgi:hypothetical protein